jgi:hypothetical protein
MDLVALLATLAAVCIGVWKFGRTIEPPGLADLFRTSHELGWPVGVQEEDLPPAFGSKVRPRVPRGVSIAALYPVAEPDVAPPEWPAGSVSGHAWRAFVSDVRIAAGTARR